MGLDRGSVVLLSVLLRPQDQGRSGVLRRSTLSRQGLGIYMAYVRVLFAGNANMDLRRILSRWATGGCSLYSTTVSASSCPGSPLWPAKHRGAVGPEGLLKSIIRKPTLDCLMVLLATDTHNE